MLIRFHVGNFLSFREEVEFSMISGLSRLHPGHKVEPKKPRDFSLLRTAVIYGANASGKSNFIKAIQFARKLITNSPGIDQSIPVRQYKLSNQSLQKPCSFRFEIMLGFKSYDYGFSVIKKRIVNEWLYEITRDSERMLFERVDSKVRLGKIRYNQFGEGYSVSKQKQRLQFVADDTRENQLFFTATIERKQPYFRELFHWFASNLFVIRPDYKFFALEHELSADKVFFREFEFYLKKLDTGIEGIELVPVELDSLFKKYNNIEIGKVVDKIKLNSRAIISAPDGIRYSVKKIKSGEIILEKLMTKHRKNEGDGYELFEISEESQGTQRLMDLIPAFIIMSQKGGTFFIDELGRSLHSTLSYQLLEVFLKSKRFKNSQLILTTHDLGLMSFELLRKDEIWFIEKSSDGDSSIFSLEEFKQVRYDKDIRKDYLLGRYRAVPQIDKRLFESQLSFN